MITVVLATYNRPQVLAAAIESVRLQTYADWRLLVVGDGCEASTGQCVEAFRDPRIAYVNLPRRCGEQSLPNSVGLRLAKPGWVALMNHDDLWLRDHLDQARKAFADPAVDLFVARAACASRSSPGPTGEPMVQFSGLSPAGRTLPEAFWGRFQRFEPASAWVFRRSLVDRIGGWRPAAELHRVPLQDWLLRAWRAGAQLVNGPVSVLHVNTQHQAKPGARTYAWPGEDQQALLERVRATNPEDLRAELAAEVARAEAAGQGTAYTQNAAAQMRWAARRISPLFLNRAWACVYRWTGWDAFTLLCAITGTHRGAHLRVSLARRTGEQLPSPPVFHELLEDARRQLERQEGWRP